MPTPTKQVANMSKHMTPEERERREAAEAALQRANVRLVKPAFVTGAAARIWRETVARMAGIDLLDDLDSETLGLYCAQLARRNQLERLRGKMARQAAKLEAGDETLPDLLAQLDRMEGKVASLERQILQYAEKLGMTPSGRMRIARRRASEAQVDPDDDLFG